MAEARQDDLPVTVTAGLVLAGGEGRRMEGRDKGLQTYNAEALALRAARRLARQVPTVLISANRHLAEYRAWGYPVVQDDERHRGRGPLAGMLAGLKASPGPWLACVPCDVPHFPNDLVSRLARAAAGQQVVFAAAGESPPPSDTLPRRHPTCCLLHRSLIEPLEHYLDAGGRRIDAWMREQAHAEVQFDEAQAFANLNTLAELQAHQAASATPRR